MRIARYTRIFSALVVVSTGTSHAADNIPQPSEKWQPQIELEGRTNSDRSLIYPKLMIPIVQDETSMLFADIRGRFDDQSSQEYNLGLGYRQMHHGWIYGGYGYVDHLRSTNGFDYWQGTAGLEALSTTWEARINGYLPQSNSHSLGSGGPGTSSLSIDPGGNFDITTTSGSLLNERALPGFDGEIGYTLPVKAVDMRVFAGGYYFAAPGYETVAGPKARFEMTMDDRQFDFFKPGMGLTIGAQFQNDGPRENTLTGLAQLTIPFGDDTHHYASSLNPLEKRMNNFIERDVDIIASKGSSGGGTSTTTTTAAETTINGVNYTKVATTIDATTPDINTALTTAGMNALVVMNGTINLDTQNGGVGLIPLNGQAIVGGGTTLTFSDLTNTHSLNATLPGSRGIFTDPGTSVSRFITLSNKSSVTLQSLDMNFIPIGFNIFMNGGAHDILVKDVNLKGGMLLSGGNNIAFVHDTMDDTGAFGGFGIQVDTTSLSGDIAVTHSTHPCVDSGGNTGSLDIGGGLTCP